MSSDDRADEPGSIAAAPPKAAAGARSEFEERGILGSMLRMGVPSMIGFLSLNIYDLADMFWVSRLGADCIAAITFFQAFHWVVSSANQIIGTGSVAVISRRYGEGNHGRTEASIKETLLLKWISGILFGALGYILLPRVMVIVGATGSALDMAIRYGRISFLALGINFATFSLYTALRSVDDPRKAMALMLGGTILNALLDPFLIFGWGPFPALGIEGAAVASVAGYTATYLAGMVILYGGLTNVRLRWRNEVALSWSSMKQILGISLPSAVSQISWSLGRVVVMPFIAVFGTGVVAAYGMATRVVLVGILATVGLGLGVASLTGHNLGAGLLIRARRTASVSLSAAVGLNCAYGAFVAAFAVPIAGLFLRDPALTAAGAEILRIQAVSFPFTGAFIIMENVHSGAGDTVPPMMYNVLLDWIFLVPVVVVGTKWLGFDATHVWWTITGAVIAATTAFYFHFRKERWLHREV